MRKQRRQAELQDKRDRIRMGLIPPDAPEREEMRVALKKQAEEAREQVRRQHQASIKKGKYQKHSAELEEVRLSVALCMPDGR